MPDGALTRKRPVKDVVALTSLFTRERATGIEPAFSAWEPVFGGSVSRAKTPSCCSAWVSSVRRYR
jgi:hypothetical protein